MQAECNHFIKVVIAACVMFLVVHDLAPVGCVFILALKINISGKQVAGFNNLGLLFLPKVFGAAQLGVDCNYAVSEDALHAIPGTGLHFDTK
jgi:hypothetical protein